MVEKPKQYRYINFEEFLQDKFAEDYVGLDDEMPDAFDDWIQDLDVDDFIRWANAYAETIRREADTFKPLSVKAPEVKHKPIREPDFDQDR